MLVVHVHVHVTPGNEEAFLEASRENARHSLLEPGVRRFDVLRDTSDGSHFVLVEAFLDKDAAAAHKTTAHYARWRDTVAGWMREPRSATSFEAAFPVEEERWRTPPGAGSDTMALDG